MRKPAAIIFTCHIYDYHGAVQNKGALDTQHMKFVKISQLTSEVQNRFSIFESSLQVEVFVILLGCCQSIFLSVVQY